MVVEGRALDQGADAAERRSAPADVLAEDANDPLRWSDEIEDHPNRGRLSGPVGAEKAEHLPNLHLEVETSNRCDAGPTRSENLGQTTHLDRRLHES